MLMETKRKITRNAIFFIFYMRMAKNYIVFWSQAAVMIYSSSSLACLANQATLRGG